MDVREEVLFKELGQNIQRKQKEDREKKQKEESSAQMQIVKEEVLSVNSRQVIEEELIRLLLQYGDLIVDLKDEQGELYQTTVIEEIISQFETNDLRWGSELYQSIFEDIKLGFENEELRTGDFFVKIFDEEKTKIASEAMMEKYSLSENWSKKLNIHIKPKEDNISKDINDTILRYKSIYLEEVIGEYSQILMQEDISGEVRNEQLEKIMILTEMRAKIFKALNRVI